ncbi:MAG TPA: MgtC/SapB family protein [Isosphaeraceae bacterium]|nr:MgtC/SapB family protein [Isosphaeraceae bacterium]
MPPLDMSLRLAVALIAGGAIGFERQWRRRPAGLRTHLMASLASATFMLVSTHLMPYQHYPPDEPYLRADVTRIAAGVVIGISFLGAGAILRHNGRIKGLTTAASLWLSTALGLAAGAGMFLLTALSTVAALFVLVVIRFWEDRMPTRPKRVIRILIGPEGPNRQDLMKDIDALADVRRANFEFNAPDHTSRIELYLGFDTHENLHRLMAHLEALPDLRRLSVSHREM